MKRNDGFKKVIKGQNSFPPLSISNAFYILIGIYLSVIVSSPWFALQNSIFLFSFSSKICYKLNKNKANTLRINNLHVQFACMIEFVCLMYNLSYVKFGASDAAILQLIQEGIVSVLIQKKNIFTTADMNNIDHYLSSTRASIS